MYFSLTISGIGVFSFLEEEQEATSKQNVKKMVILNGDIFLMVFTVKLQNIGLVLAV